jgi:hypothetical protein
MKRSGQVGLAVMGVAAFAATYASVAAYRAGTAAPVGPQSAAVAQTCATRSDGTQSCEAARRGFGYYLIPHFVHGWWGNNTPAQKPAAFAGNAPASKPQSAALTYNTRPTTPAVSSSSAQRGGFGTTAQGNSSFRVSAGG